MPLNFLIDPREEYLDVKVSGEFDLSGANEMIRRAFDIARQKGLHKLFVDVRQMKGPIQDLDQFKLAEFLALERGSPPFRIAILKEVGLIRLDSFFETVAFNRGAIPKVTTDLEEAFRWLEIKPPNNTAAAA